MLLELARQTLVVVPRRKREIIQHVVLRQPLPRGPVFCHPPAPRKPALTNPRFRCLSHSQAHPVCAHFTCHLATYGRGSRRRCRPPRSPAPCIRSEHRENRTSGTPRLKHISLAPTGIACSSFRRSHGSASPQIPEQISFKTNHRFFQKRLQNLMLLFKIGMFCSDTPHLDTPLILCTVSVCLCSKNKSSG